MGRLLKEDWFLKEKLMKRIAYDNSWLGINESDKILCQEIHNRTQQTEKVMKKKAEYQNQLTIYC